MEKYKESKVLKGCNAAIWICFAMCLFFYLYTRGEHNSLYQFKMSYYPDMSIIYFVLHYGNGRILGNLMGVLLLKNPYVFILIKTVLAMGIIYLATNLFGIKRYYAIAFTLMNVVMLPREFFDVYLYSSSFINYMIPLFFQLILIRYVIKNRENNAVVFLLALCSAFWIEHIALVNILIPIVYLILHCYTNKRKVEKADWGLVTWFLGAAIGFVVEMLIPLCIGGNKLARTHMGVTLNVDGIDLIIDNIFEMCLAVFPVTMLFTLMLAVLYARNIQSEDGFALKNAVMVILIVMSCVPVVRLVFGASVVLSYCKTCKSNEDKMIGIILYIISFIAMAVFIFAECNGPRCLFYSNFVYNILLIKFIEKFKLKGISLNRV